MLSPNKPLTCSFLVLVTATEMFLCILIFLDLMEYCKKWDSSSIYHCCEYKVTSSGTCGRQLVHSSNRIELRGDRVIGLCISNMTIIFIIIVHTYSTFSFVYCKETETPISVNCLKSSSITLILEIILLFLLLLFYFYFCSQCFFTLYIHFYYHVLKIVLILTN